MPDTDYGKKFDEQEQRKAQRISFEQEAIESEKRERYAKYDQDELRKLAESWLQYFERNERESDICLDRNCRSGSAVNEKYYAAAFVANEEFLAGTEWELRIDTWSRNPGMLGGGYDAYVVKRKKGEPTWEKRSTRRREWAFL